MYVIEVERVTKEFRLGQLTSFGQTLRNGLARLQGKPTNARAPFKALDNVSFRVEQGEVLGIIGHNGAGKSTVLKLLAGITRPTTGKVTVRGRVAPLIEVGAGLVPDMTGRENVFLNASILGMKRTEIKRKFDEIVAFAELEEFIDTPIKRYSSGMQVRLGFSIATAIESEILIVDEVLAVGDLAFQRRCFDRMEDTIKRQGKTVLIVSHNIRQLERLCSRVILLDRGKVVSDGNPTKTCNQFFDRSNAKIKAEAQQLVQRQVHLTDDLNVTAVQVFNKEGQATDRIECLRPMSVRVSFDVLKPLRRICFLVGVHTTDFIYLTANNTVEQTQDFDAGPCAIRLHIKSMTLLPGVYSLRIWVGTPEGKYSFYGENLCTFQVYSDDHLITRQQEMGLFYLDGSWDVEGGFTSTARPTIGHGLTA